MPTEKLGTPRTPDPGFLGATSFSDVYAEGLTNLNHDRQDERSGELTEQLYLPNRESQIRRGMTCIALLADMPKFEPLLESWHSIAASSFTLMTPFIHPLQKSIRSGLYEDIAAVPASERETLLYEQSTRIWQSSLENMDLPDHCSIKTFSDILSDRIRLRWVALGLFFNDVGLAALYAQDSQPRRVFAERRRLAKLMLEASDICVSFCEELGDLSDAETWLYSGNVHLASLVEGDASYMFWRRLGDLISICIAQGLHMEIEVSKKVPFWLSETRKRTFSHAYILDKNISSFMGRPPRLARKYCSMQLPLDIATKHLWLPESELAVEVNALDNDGWNTVGERRVNLYSRTQLICSMIQEDILEFALASVPHNDISVAEEILRRCRSAWASLPSWITSPDQAHPLTELECLMSEIALGFKYSEFLLYRAVVKRFPSEHANEELLRLSSSLLTNVMQNVNNTQAAGRYNADLPWVLAKFALPTAGVLGLELLLQHQNSDGAKASPPSSFRRSTVIQTLSNLVATLGMVMPLDGDYRICNQARLALQHILDRVLNPPSTISCTVNQDDEAFEAKLFPANAGLWHDQPWSEPDFWTALPTHPLFMVETS